MDIIKYSNITTFTNKFLFYCMRGIYFFWKKNNYNHFNPRIWSNMQLKIYSNHFVGDIVNVSGGNDQDKEGGIYRDYFSNSTSYSITNFKNDTSDNSGIELDLNLTLSEESGLEKSYDVVMTHTVLEHVYDLNVAVKNLCLMSRDAIITIVPFIQSFHQHEEEYSDYWRFTPFALKRMFEAHKFETVYMSWNDDPLGNIYIFHVASLSPEKWSGITDGGWFRGVRGPGYDRNMLVWNSSYCKNVIINKCD